MIFKMSFGNYQNEKNSNKKKTSTKAIQFYNSACGSTLVTSHYNEATIIFKIHPTLPENKQSNTNVYDYDSYVACFLSPLKLIELREAIKNTMMNVSSLDRYSFEPVGVDVADGFIEIAPAKTYGINLDAIALCIYNGIDENWKASNKLVYVFNTSHYYKNFATKGGDYEASDKVDSEFILFMTLLDESIKGATKAIAHSLRDADKYQRTNILESIKELKEKAGIKTYNQSSTTTYFGAKSNQNKNMENVGQIENAGQIGEQERIPLQMPSSL